MRIPFSRIIIYIAVAAAQFPAMLDVPGSKESFLCSSSAAHADGIVNRMARWTGYGWSSGYHACQNDGFQVRDGLPPVSNSAEARQRIGGYSFELAAPAHLVSRQSTYRNPPTRPSETVDVIFDSSSLDQSWQNGGSILSGSQLSEPLSPLQPYQSVNPPPSSPVPTSPRVNAQGEPVSPSDIENLPKPKGQSQPDSSTKTDSARSFAPSHRPTRLPATVR